MGISVKRRVSNDDDHYGTHLNFDEGFDLWFSLKHKNCCAEILYILIFDCYTLFDTKFQITGLTC